MPGPPSTCCLFRILAMLARFEVRRFRCSLAFDVETSIPLQTADKVAELAQSRLHIQDNSFEIVRSNTLIAQLCRDLICGESALCHVRRLPRTYLVTQLFLRFHMALFEFIVEFLESFQVFNGNSHLFDPLR